MDSDDCRLVFAMGGTGNDPGDIDVGVDRWRTPDRAGTVETLRTPVVAQA